MDAKKPTNKCTDILICYVDITWRIAYRFAPKIPSTNAYKLLSTLIKFMALYVLINDTKGTLSQSMQHMYDKVCTRLKAIYAMKNDVGLYGTKTVKYNKQYINKVKKDLSMIIKATDIYDLVVALKLVRSNTRD
jgi:hypothetical protein